MTTTPNLMSPKQTDFINDLVKRKDVPDRLQDAIRTATTRTEASMLINSLLTLRDKPKARVAPAVSPEYREYLAALDDAVVSKYAVPTRYLTVSLPHLAKGGDLLFLEVRNYSGKRYFSRLVGAPGRFSRYRIGREDALVLLKLIHGRHIEFAKLFADHYSVCGRCAAELTDQKSRETGFGGTCRKIFGL